MHGMHQTKEVREQNSSEPMVGTGRMLAWGSLNDTKNPAVMGIDAAKREGWCLRIDNSIYALNNAAVSINEKGSSAEKVKLTDAKRAVCKKLDEIVRKAGEKKISKFDIEREVPEKLAAIESEVEKIAAIAQAKAGRISAVEPSIKEVLPPIMELLPAIAHIAPAKEASEAVTAESLLRRFIGVVGKNEWASSGMNGKFMKVFTHLKPESLRVANSVVFDYLRGGVPHITFQQVYVILDVIDDLFAETGVVDREKLVKALDFIWKKEKGASNFWGNPPFGPCHVARMEITNMLKSGRAAGE
jgi:hypothetical protein